MFSSLSCCRTAMVPPNQRGVVMAGQTRTWRSSKEIGDGYRFWSNPALPVLTSMGLPTQRAETCLRRMPLNLLAHVSQSRVVFFFIPEAMVYCLRGTPLRPSSSSLLVQSASSQSLDPILEFCSREFPPSEQWIFLAVNLDGGAT